LWGCDVLFLGRAHTWPLLCERRLGRHKVRLLDGRHARGNKVISVDDLRHPDINLGWNANSYLLLLVCVHDLGCNRLSLARLTVAFDLADILVDAAVHVLGAGYANIHVLKQFTLASRVRVFLGVLALVFVAVVIFHVVDFIFGVWVRHSFLVARVFGQGIVCKLVHAGAPTKLDEFYA